MRADSRTEALSEEKTTEFERQEGADLAQSCGST